MMKTKNKRWWDIPAAIFLFGALFSAAVRLHLTNWTENLSRVELIVILGSIFGFALAKSVFRGRTTFVMGLVYSVFVLPWQLGLIMPEMDWNARLLVLYARLWYATADFLANRPVRDPILFISTMMVLYWFASLLASYRLVRSANPWLPLLSLGGMLLVIEYTMEMYRYTSVSGGGYSFLFLTCCLLLLGRIYFLRSRYEWEKRGGTVEMEVGYDLGRGVAIAAVVVVLLAWNTPRIINLFDSNNPARERVSENWRVFRDRVSKAVNSLRSPNQMVVQGYGSSMSLGTGGSLTDDVVFTVTPDIGRLSGRMYWAARTYDLYEDGQWQSTIGSARSIGPAETPLVYPAWQMRKQVSFLFNTRTPLLRTIYYTNEPLNLNRTAQAIVSQADDGAMDLNAIIMDPPLEGGDPYIVQAIVPEPSVLAMREAGEDYPDWIKERYLQLPEGFSTRIVDQARQIAGSESTPYDKALAITQYLRRTITYTETVPDPPRNRDPLEWFLFDQRSGFCNYYASSEVMMLRSLGVPARLVAGYAEGTWDPALKRYNVLSKDSHAWPEVYFPKLGWVAFEPTVSQPLSTFPTGSEEENASVIGAQEPDFVPTDDPSHFMGEQRAEQMDAAALEAARRAQMLQSISGWTIAAVVIVLLAAVLVFLEWRRRKTQDLPLPSWIEKTLDERGVRTPEWLRMWSRRSLRTPMENLFTSVTWMLRVWGRKIDPSLTPAEQVETLVNVVPGVKAPALALLEEYQRAMYSQYPANFNRAQQAVVKLKSIGYRNWVMRLVGLEVS